MPPHFSMRERAIMYVLKDSPEPLTTQEVGDRTVTGSFNAATLWTLERCGLITGKCRACKPPQGVSTFDRSHFELPSSHVGQKVWSLNLRGSMTVDQIDPDPQSRAELVDKWRHRLRRRYILFEAGLWAFLILFSYGIMWLLFGRFDPASFFANLGGGLAGLLGCKLFMKICKNRRKVDKKTG